MRQTSLFCTGHDRDKLNLFSYAIFLNTNVSFYSQYLNKLQVFHNPILKNKLLMLIRFKKICFVNILKAEK